MKFALAAILALLSTARAETITLDQYLNQVRNNNAELKGVIGNAQGAEDRSGEGRLLLAPTLVGNFEYADDGRETITPAFQGTRNKTHFYTLGIRQLTTFGTQATLSYQARRYQVYDALPSFIPMSSYYDTRPVLEVTQSLWRNFFGAETRHYQEFLEADALSTSYGNSYRGKQIIAQAEGAYWRLALAREIVKVLRESVARAQTMRSYMEKQSSKLLADRSDFLQADAALRVRQLELQGALDSEQSAAMDFNTTRGIEHGAVNEAFPTLLADAQYVSDAPKRADFRDDVKQAREFKRLAVAKAEMGLQKESPTLDVYASLSLNGRDVEMSKSSSESFTSKNQWYVFGVRFSAPLNIGLVSDVRGGYAKERIAAEQVYEHRVFQQNQEWEDLQRRFKESKERLKLARSIENVQKEKLENERDRQRRGRSTTYQVILFEQDFANAQLSRIKNQSEILEILSQMKIFGS